MTPGPSGACGAVEEALLIRHESDVFAARRLVRDVAKREGMRLAETEALVTAVSEIARNVLVHAGSGRLSLGVSTEGDDRTLVVVTVDEGQGIPDLQRAMTDGYSTKGGLGYGLSGAQRLTDAFEIVSEVGRGTTVTLKKRIHPCFGRRG